MNLFNKYKIIKREKYSYNFRGTLIKLVILLVILGLIYLKIIK